jgi:hypothetical protein
MPNGMLSRRDFLKRAGGGAIGVGVFSPLLLISAELGSAPAVDKHLLVSALADAIMPTSDGYPGYRRLEPRGITEEVLKGLQGISSPEWNFFNAAAQDVLGKPFVDLSEDLRTQYLESIVAAYPPDTFGSSDPTSPPGPAAEALKSRYDGASLAALQKVFLTTRNRVFTVFYQNFPEHRVERDANQIPVLKPGDTHQIINPNTSNLVTGWDVANFPGPLSWEEEEARRAYWMKIHWHYD